jgi:hypothetical protein
MAVAQPKRCVKIQKTIKKCSGAWEAKFLPNGGLAVPQSLAKSFYLA